MKNNPSFRDEESTPHIEAGEFKSRSGYKMTVEKVNEDGSAEGTILGPHGEVPAKWSAVGAHQDPEYHLQLNSDKVK